MLISYLIYNQIFVQERLTRPCLEIMDVSSSSSSSFSRYELLLGDSVRGM